MSDLARLKTGRVFCAKACRDAAGSKPRRGVTSPCAECGAGIYYSASRPQKYCSKRCHDQGQRTDQAVTACAGCGNEFQHRPSAKRKYCSKACEADARIVRTLGRVHNGRPARVNAAGYVMVWEPEHSSAYGAGWLLEHRLIAELTLGRPLESADEVHHINRVKTDNRPENLVVLSGPDHAYITALDNWRDLREMKAQLARYRELYGPLPEE
ncbi:HNH endonuclease signature motif containing protein [Streptomyces scabiei]|uniref:HNH endonuclease signature motif containing protein n=1 Tax=Streptomyces scabiei TaxID=1930 RepID=UPI0029BBCF92|nr:HNH endonuclease signature motif containing protein [Streptomyces scabiei]MDX3294615.1 HNH endonuclease signature motif containing protein [Streptomyces scabiei]